MLKQIQKIFIIMLIFLFAFTNLTNAYFLNNFHLFDKKTYTKLNKERQNITLVKDYDILFSIIKKHFYNNNISLKNIKNDISKYLTDDTLNLLFDKNLKKTKPAFQLISSLLLIESDLDGLHWKYTVQDIYKTLPEIDYDNLKNVNYDILDNSFLNKFVWNYYNYKNDNYNHFYCNIGNIIDNHSNIVYISKHRDISKYYENKHAWQRNKIWQKISVCKIINNYLTNKYYKKNIYMMLEGKTSYAGAILTFQFMPNNLVYMLEKTQATDVNLWNIWFYYKTVAKFLFGDNYKNVFKEINNTFYKPNEFKKCIYNHYNPTCKKVRKEIFRYNHADWYVDRILKKANDIKEISDAWFIFFPINNAWIKFKKENVLFKIRNFPLIITQSFKWKKHWGIDVSYHAYYINDMDTNKKRIINVYKDNIELVYNNNQKMNCYYMKNNKNGTLTKRIWNVIYCKNSNYGLIYWHVKWLADGVKVEKINNKLLPDTFFKNYKLALIWNKHINNKKGFYIKNLEIYEIKDVKPWKVLAYMGNTWVTSGPHLHYWITNLQTWKFVYNNTFKRYFNSFYYYK